jgi:hypothetical protein
LKPPLGLLERKRVTSSTENPEPWEADPKQGSVFVAKRPGWEWFVYESLFTEQTIDNMYIDLRHNSAEINGVFNLPGLGKRFFTWFSYDRAAITSSKVPKTDLYGKEFLDIKTRIASRRRMVEVQPQTFIQTLADISGSFAGCVVVGTFFCIVAQLLFEKKETEDDVDLLISAFHAGDKRATTNRLPPPAPPIFSGNVGFTYL